MSGSYSHARQTTERRLGTVPEQAVVLEPGDSPWDVDGRPTLLITGRGVFVVRQEALYAYARRPTVRDFQAVFGDTGRELAYGRLWTPFQLVHPLPLELLWRAWSYFAAAWSRYQTEDILFLLCHLNEKRYELQHPPLRFASEAGVGFEVPPAPAGAVTFGTFHSHPEAAFHSETDDADVRRIPGLHVVIGNLASKAKLPHVACFFSAGEEPPFPVHFCDVFASPSPKTWAKAFPPEWLVRPADLPKYLPTGPAVSTDHRKGEVS